MVWPDAPRGLVFPGDPGIGRRHRAERQRRHAARSAFAWDPTGAGVWSVRASYGLFYDQFQNGAGTASQVPVSSIPWAQFNQFSGAGPQLPESVSGPRLSRAEHVRAAVHRVHASTRRRSRPTRRTGTSASSARCSTGTCVEVRYVGAKGSRLPRNIEDNPAVYGPGATAQNADRRRVYANCPADGGTCDFSTIAMLSYITHSNYEAGQVSLSRRYRRGVGFNVSYWLSSTKDELSSMNLSGAAAKPLAGENDLAQNPFDVGAEYGPSLFDARHRFVASASWEPRVPDSAPSAVRAIFGGWQLNGIATLNSGTPFTVSDSANVSLQANSPPISGLRGQPSRTWSAIRTPVRTPSTSG